MDEIKFKKATINNWGQVEKLEKSSATPLFAACSGEAGYKRYIKESKVFFIMYNKKSIGTISYKIENDETVLINGLTVLPEYRGKGIATNAMKKLLSNLRNKNFSLLVHPEKTVALLIYLRLGFVITDWKDNYFGDGQPRLFLKKVSKKTQKY